MTEAFAARRSGTLYCFGSYHSAKRLPEYEGELTPVAEDRLARKCEICSLYRSQKRTVDKLSHMLPYEEWEEAELP